MPLVLYLIVILTALLAQSVNDAFILAFMLACLVLPLLADKTRTPWQTLAVRRAGWLMAMLLAAGSFVGAYALSFIAAKVSWGTILLPLALEAQIEWGARQFAIYLLLAFAEEFFFRGYLQETVFRARWDECGWGLLTRKNLTASILFGLAHVVSHTSLWQLAHVLGSIILGWVVERSERSILPATFLHAASNVAGMLVRILLMG